MNILETLSAEFDIKPHFLQNTIQLIDEGATIPFIARYRKEMTGSLEDTTLRELFDRLAYLRNMAETREKYRNTIEELGGLSEDVAKALDLAKTLTELEDIYRPFRPKRRTRATVAREKGLAPLAELIFGQNMTEDALKAAAKFVNPEKEVATAEDALKGAMDIIAEIISDEAKYRTIIREVFVKKGVVSSKKVELKSKDDEKQSVYEMYFEFAEPVKKMAGHRVLAVNRGEREGFLSVDLEEPVEEIIGALEKSVNRGNDYTKDIISEVIEDSYKRLIRPAIEREIRAMLTERSEEGAIRVFGENLRQLLLTPPIKDKTVLALDPGFRNGCKCAVIDGTGKPLYTAVIYPTMSAKNREEAKQIVVPIIDKYGVDVVAIGNGTASRETEQFTAEILKETKNDKIAYVIVNEAGASVYSASKLGSEEFPEYDVSLRSAVSIGRRLQDPLAELVKIDPKSIGVGQYQHDMNQKRLGETLSGVVESCVNSVGVDLNTASPSLLGYVAGINTTVAKNILEYREKNGKFNNRKELLKVPKLGPKAFEQCAGFLRVSGGVNPLDETGVHPESYAIAEKFLSELGLSVDDLRTKKVGGVDRGKIEGLAQKLGVGVPTLTDIVKELEKPGRDPRDDMPKPVLRHDVLSMEDLTVGMELMGTVRNIMDFGCFVDIGVHHDGLVHISQITEKFIKHPLDAVKVGDVVAVHVLAVDIGKKRISLSMRKKN